MKKFLIVIIFLGLLATLYATGTKLNFNQLPDGAPQLVTLTLDSAQIVQCYTSGGTPLQIVASPGSGKIAMPYFATIEVFSKNHTPYTNVQPPVLVWRSPGGTYTSGVIKGSGTSFSGAVNEFAPMAPYTTTAQIFSADSVVNCPLFFAIGGSQPAGGNSTATVKVYYNIITP